MAEEKKKTTTTTKKKTTTKKTNTKKTSTTRSNSNKRNTTRKTTTNNKTPRKRTRKTVKASDIKTPIETNEVVMQETVKPVELEEEIKITEDLPEVEDFDPKKVKDEEVDTKEEREELAMALSAEVADEIKEIKEEIKEDEAVSSKDKMVDLGIIIVVIGLFVLVLTTYLNNVIELSYQETNILVIIALAIEALGVGIMLVGTFKKNK